MKTHMVFTRTIVRFGFALCAASIIAYPVSPNDPANTITTLITVPPGWSLIANPHYHNRGITLLDAVADNSVGELFKDVPQGTVLLKFENSTQDFSENHFRGHRWSNPNETLVPGEGAWIFNPARKSFAVAFTGNCRYGGSIEVPAGLSLVSSPDCGTINFAPLIWTPPEDCLPCPPGPPTGWDSLSFNPQDGDVVYTFKNGQFRRLVPEGRLGSFACGGNRRSLLCRYVASTSHSIHRAGAALIRGRWSNLDFPDVVE